MPNCMHLAKDFSLGIQLGIVSVVKSIANNFLFCFIYLARDWSLAKIARENIRRYCALKFVFHKMYAFS